MFNTREQEIVAQRTAAFTAHTTPEVGDFVEFADGMVRRIAHVWFDQSIQTSDSGEFYLGDGFVSYSGTLYASVPIATLQLQPYQQLGQFWLFHITMSFLFRVTSGKPH